MELSNVKVDDGNFLTGKIIVKLGSEHVVDGEFAFPLRSENKWVRIGETASILFSNGIKVIPEEGNDLIWLMNIENLLRQKAVQKAIIDKIVWLARNNRTHEIHHVAKWLRENIDE